MMSKPLSSEVKTKSQKTQFRLINLYRIYLDRTTLYLAHSPEDIQFFDEDGSPVTYMAAAITHTPTSSSLELRSDTVTVNIDDVAGDMSAWLAHHEFRGRRMDILQVFKSLLDDLSHAIPIFTNGTIDDMAVDDTSLELGVVGKLDILDTDVPGRTYGRECAWRFGSDECDVEISEERGTRITGVVGGIDMENTRRVYLPEIVGDDAGYWAHGYLMLMDAEARPIREESRFIMSSGSDGWIVLDMPFFIYPVGENYQLVAGCDKTYGTAEAVAIDEIDEIITGSWQSIWTPENTVSLRLTIRQEHNVGGNAEVYYREVGEERIFHTMLTSENPIKWVVNISDLPPASYRIEVEVLDYGFFVEDIRWRQSFVEGFGHGCEFWNNQDFYGGFLTVPERGV